VTASADVITTTGVLGHVSAPGPTVFIAYGLFFVGIGATWAAYALRRREGSPMAGRVGLWVLAIGCFGLATVLPFIIPPGASFVRPTSTARLEILWPRPGQVFAGQPATIDVRLRLVGGTIVPLTSTRLAPNQGHIHVSLDGTLASMTGLSSTITAPPGAHTLRTEFVAADHAPFRTRILATVAFQVLP
jgi:hypothetical protein